MCVWLTRNVFFVQLFFKDYESVRTPSFHETLSTILWPRSRTIFSQKMLNLFVVLFSWVYSRPTRCFLEYTDFILNKGVRPPPKDDTELMMRLLFYICRVWKTPSLPSLLGSLWHKGIVTVLWVVSMGWICVWKSLTLDRNNLYHTTDCKQMIIIK